MDANYCYHIKFFRAYKYAFYIAASLDCSGTLLAMLLIYELTTYPLLHDNILLSITTNGLAFNIILSIC